MLEGELDLLAFHPSAAANSDWRTWESEAGTTVLRGGPGSVMFVPAGGPPDQAEIAALRRRHDIHPLTSLTNHPLG